MPFALPPLRHCCRAVPMPARAQTLHGVGNTTCSQFLRAARMSDMLYHQASNWLLGYVSGMNAALASTGASAAAVNLSNDQIAEIGRRLLRGQSGQDDRERGGRMVPVAAAPGRRAGRAAGGAAELRPPQQAVRAPVRKQALTHAARARRHVSRFGRCRTRPAPACTSGPRCARRCARSSMMRLAMISCTTPGWPRSCNSLRALSKAAPMAWTVSGSNDPSFRNGTMVADKAVPACRRRDRSKISRSPAPTGDRRLCRPERAVYTNLQSV